MKSCWSWLHLSLFTLGLMPRSVVWQVKQMHVRKDGKGIMNAACIGNCAVCWCAEARPQQQPVTALPDVTDEELLELAASQADQQSEDALQPRGDRHC